MKIAVYRGPSQNNVLTRMAESLGRALPQVGIEAVTVEAHAGGMPALARTVRDGGFDHVVSFASFSAEMKADDGRSLFDSLDLGFVGWDVDHPAYHFHRIATPIARRIQVCASQSHTRFARAVGFKGKALVTLPGVEAVADDPTPMQHRSDGAMVAATWLCEPDRFWDRTKGTPIYRLIDGLVERVMADRSADLFAAYEKTCTALDFKLPIDAAVSSILGNVGLYVRRHDRLKIVEALAAADFPCLIIGDGWGDRLKPRPGLSFAPPADFNALSALYGDARVVVNINAANGGSERVVQAMAAGAAVVSEDSALIASDFGTTDAVRFFDRRKPSSVVPAIQALLDGEAEGVAARGHGLVATTHLWTHKAKTLADALAS